MNRTIGITIALSAAGCIDYDLPQDLPVWPDSDPPDLAPVTREDRIVQVATPVVDVLFVVDNSCSMDDEQAYVAANFPSFMSYFEGSGLDYHVGVVSTDLDDPAHRGKLQGVDGEPYIDLQTAEPEQIFAEMAILGTEGTGEEKGLGAAYLALEDNRETYNDGFYRDEAAVHTIVVSDEIDHTDTDIVSKKEFIEWYDGLKRRSNERTFSSIVHTSGTQRGAQYLDVTASIGGITWDIATDNWSRVLDLLGVQASGLKREYFLSHLPVPTTIEVEVHDPNGTVLPFSEAIGDPPTDGWTYDRRRNSITFVEFMPEPLSEVILRYRLLADQQETAVETGGD